MIDGNRYDGLALFDGATAVHFAAADGNAIVVTSSAVYGMRLNGLEFTHAEVGGLNMRNTVASGLVVENSAFDTVDVTGSTFGSDAARSRVVNSTFDHLSANEASGSTGDPSDPTPGSRLP